MSLSILQSRYRTVYLLSFLVRTLSDKPDLL